MEIVIDPVEPPINGVLIPNTYFMYGLAQLEPSSHVVKAVAFKYRLESPFIVLKKDKLDQFKTLIKSYKGIVVPNKYHFMAFWWLSEDINFCVVKSTGPRFEVDPREDICTQLLRWTACTPAPPNGAVYIIPRPQPPLIFLCQVCCREASCTKAYRHLNGQICHLCCLCYKISPVYWIRSEGLSAKCRECRHCRFFGVKAFDARAEVRRKEYATAEARRGVPDIHFGVPEEERNDLEEGSQDEKMCPICHDDMQAPVQMECNKKHRFCLKCIYVWVYQSPPQPTCPICRQMLTFNP